MRLFFVGQLWFWFCSWFCFSFNDLQCKTNSFIMFSARSRNQSLKTLYQPKTERKEPEPIALKLKGSGLLPTIAENRQVHRMQAKQLGLSITKFQNMIARNSNEINQQDLIRNIYFIIKNFGEVDNNFKSLFGDLQVRLKDYLFLNDAEISQKYKIREGCTYKKAIKLLDKFHCNVVVNKDQQIDDLQGKIDKIMLNYKEQLKNQQVEIFSLKQQVEKYKKMADVEYVRSLQRKVEDLKEIVSSQQDQYKILAKKNEEISLELEAVRRDLNQQQMKCATQQSSIYDLNVHKERTQIYLLNLKDRFDQLKGRMDALQLIIRKVENENEILVAERAKLVNRAAVTFEDLTPRPKYSNFFVFDEKINLKSTGEIVTKLIEQGVSNKKQFFEKYCVTKKNRKLMECESIRQKTVQEINKAKSELLKLI